MSHAPAKAPDGLHHRIAVRAYFFALDGIGRDDLDRWLTAEAMEHHAASRPAPTHRRRYRW